jgi:hypothetical protein
MSKPKQTAPEARVTCEMCLKQVPASEATIPEAVDYFVQFCGLDCYDLWQKKIQQGQSQAKPKAKPESR